MKIEDKIETLSELFYNASKKMSSGQKKYAQRLLDEIIDHIENLEIKTENLKAKLSGLTSNDYLNSLEKCIDIMQCLGIDLLDVSLINKEETDFIKLHLGTIQKSGPITKQRIFNIIELFRYFRRTRDYYPTHINQLTEVYNEIREVKKQD